jgi:hypothetical protein
MGTSSRTVRCGRCAGPIFHSCPHGTGLVQRLGYSIGYSHGALALILDRLLFRPDVSQAGRATCERSALLPVAEASRGLLLLLSPLLSAQISGERWGGALVIMYVSSQNDAFG